MGGRQGRSLGAQLYQGCPHGLLGPLQAPETPHRRFPAEGKERKAKSQAGAQSEPQGGCLGPSGQTMGMGDSKASVGGRGRAGEDSLQSHPLWTLGAKA